MSFNNTTGKEENYYEEKITEILKHLIKSRIAHHKSQIIYNERPTNSNQKKLEDKQLDVVEDLETLHEYNDNYGHIRQIITIVRQPPQFLFFITTMEY